MQGQPSSARASSDDPPCQFVNPLEPEAGRAWDALALSAANATVFHTSAWARVLADSYRYRPSYVVFQPEDGERTLLPMFEVKSVITGTRGVSLPFTD